MGNNIQDFETQGYVIFKTGGTTSKTKDVKKTAENLLEEAHNLQEELQLKDGLEFITTTTTEHLFGFTFYYMLPKTFGYKINPNRINYPEDLNVENAVLVTTPSFLEVLHKYNVKPPINPKIIISAGAKLEDSVFEYALSISTRVIEIYGSTETGIVGYRETPQTKSFKLFKGIKVLECNENFTKFETKYSDEPIAILDDRIGFENGEITFQKRCGRVLKIQEKRILSDEIENEISKSEYIEKVHCFEHKGKLASLGVLTQKGVDFVIKNDKLALEKILKQELKNKFDIIPQKWKFFDEIPTKENGKINRDLIEKTFDLNLSLPLVISHRSYDNGVNIELCFLNNSNFFQGHFEGFPILAGVVQLFYANWFSKFFFNIDCTTGQIRKIKFTSIIRPAQILNLDLKFDDNNDGISFKFFDENTVYSSGLLPITNYL